MLALAVSLTERGPPVSSTRQVSVADGFFVPGLASQPFLLISSSLALGDLSSSFRSSGSGSYQVEDQGLMNIHGKTHLFWLPLLTGMESRLLLQRGSVDPEDLWRTHCPGCVLNPRAHSTFICSKVLLLLVTDVNQTRLRSNR